MRVLVACEFSGIVREAFRARGHDAWSCDLLPCEHSEGGHHFEGDVRDFMRSPCPTDGEPWDLMVAFPPCTHLASSGARWFKGKRDEQAYAVKFVRDIADMADESLTWRIPRVAIENPIGVLSTRWRKPDQIIQPWQFGHGETKATCLWLMNLPKLVPTRIVSGRRPRVHYASPGPDRWKERSRTLVGIADAMAEQWGAL